MSEEGTGPNEGQPAETQDSVDTSWFDGLHEDIKMEKTLEKFKGEDGLNNLAQSYVGLEKKLGNAVWIPDPEKATPEDVNNFRSKLGVPDSPDKYEFKYKEHEALKVDENRDKAYKTLAHEIGLTPKQAQRLVDYDADRFIEAINQQNKGYEEAVKIVKEEWGNDYQMKLDMANNVIRTYADEKDMEAIKKYENDPALARVFLKIGESMSEHTFVNPNNKDVQGGRDDLKQQAEEYVKLSMEATNDTDRMKYDKMADALFVKLYGNREVTGSRELETA